MLRRFHTNLRKWTFPPTSPPSAGCKWSATAAKTSSERRPARSERVALPEPHFLRFQSTEPIRANGLANPWLVAASGRLEGKGSTCHRRGAAAAMPSSSSVLCALGAMEVLKLLSSSTVNRSTTRLVRPPRPELTSNASRSNLIPTLTTAVSRSRARVGGFMRLKKPFGIWICPGRVLHPSKLRGHRAKGSAIAAAAASAGARELCVREGSGLVPSVLL